LRHEVNLQTKAVRAQQGQNAATLDQLGRAVEALQAAGEPAGAAGDEELRPLLKTLVDARDALAFARREVERVQDSVRAALDQLAVPPASDTPDDGAGPPPSRPPGFLGRLFGRGAARPAVQDEQARLGAAEAAERVRRSFDSILTGYTMSLQRL